MVARAGLRPGAGRDVRQRQVLRHQPSSSATRSPSSAPATSSSRPAPRAGTGRSNGSSAPWTANGRTAASGPTAANATAPCHRSSASTTAADRTQPAAADRPSPAFTTSAGRTPDMAGGLSSRQHERPRMCGAFLLVWEAAGCGRCARRAVTLICAGWVPQDRVSSQSPPSSIGRRPAGGRLPIGVSRMLWREGPAVPAASRPTWCRPRLVGGAPPSRSRRARARRRRR